MTMYPTISCVHETVQESAYPEATFRQICIACSKYIGIGLGLPEDLGSQLPIDIVVRNLFEGSLDFDTYTIIGLTFYHRQKIYDELVRFVGRGCTFL